MTENIQLSDIDRHFADFIVRIEGGQRPGLWVAAALASHCSCLGHVCLDLNSTEGYSVVLATEGAGMLRTPPAADWIRGLSDCSVVARPGEYAPLVLDDAGRLYLHRSWEYERTVADGILSRSAGLSAPAGLDAALGRYFPITAGEADLQREAARAALTVRFTVISGGPGTGKTTTVARILALMVELNGGTVPRISLAAPTGKAAMRLRESIMESAGRLGLSDEIRAALPQEVSTIHRLLGVIPGSSEFRHDHNNRLPCDVLVVDEASMVDLPLMSRLLDALRDDARVLLLGDRDQLASVEAGAVLADICAGSAAGGLADRPAIVQLTRSYRFGDDSGIGRLSRLINAGDADGALELLDSGRFADVSWKPLPAPEQFADAFAKAADAGFAGFSSSAAPGVALEALDRFRVLSPHREGLHGVANLNRLAGAVFATERRAGAASAAPHPVMVTGNNYDLGLFNGDTGVLYDAVAGRAAEVYFAGGDAGVRRLSALRLPSHEAAYALTVHKTQGSEFDRVLLVLPDQFSEVLSRELLYTAVTRGRVHVEIWGDAGVFRRAVERRIERNSGLRDRLWGGGGS